MIDALQMRGHPSLNFFLSSIQLKSICHKPSDKKKTPTDYCERSEEWISNSVEKCGVLNVINAYYFSSMN